MKKRESKPRISIALFVALVAAAIAGAESRAQSAAVGVILIHGNWGSPETCCMSRLAHALENAGYLVSNPEMPWSLHRLYDSDSANADAEIAWEIGRLRSRGAQKVFLIGHSFGATYAAHYLSREDADGAVLIAPAHFMERGLATLFAEELQAAQESLELGKGGDQILFRDINTNGCRLGMRVGAATLLSYIDPRGPLNFALSLRAIPADRPILWIWPNREQQRLLDALADYRETFVGVKGRSIIDVDAEHLNSPDIAKDRIIAWLSQQSASLVTLSR